MYLAGIYLLSAVRWLYSALLPPPILVLDLSMGFMKSHIVHAAAVLGIPDVLAEGPVSLTQLAARTGVLGLLAFPPCIRA